VDRSPASPPAGRKSSVSDSLGDLLAEGFQIGANGRRGRFVIASATRVPRSRRKSAETNSAAPSISRQSSCRSRFPNGLPALISATTDGAPLAIEVLEANTATR
jgi:hypothetical protein